jgi:hypothetical protein
MALKPQTSHAARLGGGSASLAQAVGKAALAACCGVAVLCGALSARPARAEPGVPAHGTGTIALVIGAWHFGLYESPLGKQECPQGFQNELMKNYNAAYPTPEARKAHEQKFGYYTNTGPDGENIFYFPTLAKDPLPFRAAGGPTAIGLNLDGDLTGKGTAISLPHDKFTSPDGEKGVDNQLYRVIGCLPGWRKGGGIEGPVSIYIRSEQQPRVLLEITGVQDELNSPDVTVTIYRGADRVAVDSHDKLIPWLSQRIDYKNGRRYIQRLKGSIVDGVLTTEPTDVKLPFWERIGFPGDRIIKKMRLRLKLTPDGAEGLLGGYADLDNWYLMFAKTWGAMQVADIEGWSAPGLYQALHQYADYKDPVTGQPTGISAAYEVGFARTFIIHTPQSDAAIADALAGRKAPPAGAVASR